MGHTTFSADALAAGSSGPCPTENASATKGKTADDNGGFLRDSVALPFALTLQTVQSQRRQNDFRAIYVNKYGLLFVIYESTRDKVWLTPPPPPPPRLPEVASFYFVLFPLP